MCVSANVGSSWGDRQGTWFLMPENVILLDWTGSHALLAYLDVCSACVLHMQTASTMQTASPITSYPDAQQLAGHC